MARTAGNPIKLSTMAAQARMLLSLSRKASIRVEIKAGMVVAANGSIQWSERAAAIRTFASSSFRASISSGTAAAAAAFAPISPREQAALKRNLPFLVVQCLD